MPGEDFKGAYLTTCEKGLFPPGRMRGLSQEVGHGPYPRRRRGSVGTAAFPTFLLTVLVSGRSGPSWGGMGRARSS